MIFGRAIGLGHGPDVPFTGRLIGDDQLPLARHGRCEFIVFRGIHSRFIPVGKYHLLLIHFLGNESKIQQVLLPKWPVQAIVFFEFFANFYWNSFLVSERIARCKAHHEEGERGDDE